jgi:hypothetical protein
MNSTLRAIRSQSGAGVLYNFGYAVFAVIYAKWLAPLIRSGMENPSGNGYYAPWLGVLIVLTLVLETPALLYKVRRNPFDRSKSKLIIAVICLHIVMVEYAAYYAFRAFGLKGGWSSGLLMLFIAPFFLREMAVLFSFVQTGYKPKKYKRFPKVFFDLSLFITGLILATVVWDAQMRLLGGLSDLIEGSAGPAGLLSAAGRLITVFICCLLMFVPTRLGFMIEERTIDEKSERKIVRMTVILAALFGMLPYMLS